MGKDYSDIAFKDDGRLKLLIIVGTRPEVIRLSEVIKKCRRHFDCLLAHTGQNYDYTLNGIFFRDLSFDDPDVYLDAVGADLGETVGNIIAARYKLMVQVQPDALLILGDTNSCLSAIAAKRLHIPIFHMEAGNRCKDECLPEETNRRIVDVISDVNLAYSEHARRYLKDTGCAPERTYVTGSPMAEVLRANLDKIEASGILSELGLEPKHYMLLSAHREENIDTEANFTSLFTAINALAEKYDMPILYSCHPRSRKRLEATGFKLDPRVRMHEPMGFHDYNCLQMNAFAVVSDSGTLPEESSFFASVGHPVPGGVHPHLHRAPRGAGQGLLHARRHHRAGPAAGGPHRRRARRGGVASRGPRARLRRRDRVHQGGQDHPELHRRRGQDGVEEGWEVRRVKEGPIHIVLPVP